MVSCVPEADRKILNSRVIDGVKVKMPCPESTRFATYFNAKRCGINMDMFRSYLEKHHADCTEDNIPNTAIVIKANARWGKSKIPLTYEQRNVLFENCSEADIVNSRNKHLDPILCLSSGCNEMVNDNINLFLPTVDFRVFTFGLSRLCRVVALES
jgi:hypothetical protein